MRKSSTVNKSIEKFEGLLNVEGCLKLLDQNNLSREQLKLIMDSLFKIDFQKERAKNKLNLLAEYLLKLLENYKNQNLEDTKDIHGDLFFLLAHYSWLYTRAIKVLVWLAPKINITLRKNIFFYLRRTLNEVTEKALYETASKGIIRVAMLSGGEYCTMVYDFFKNEILKEVNVGYNCESLLIMAEWTLDEKERYELFSYLISILDQKSYSRTWQKNIGGTITQLFEKLFIPEKQKIFTDILKPLMNYKNYYVRQSLVEILSNITEFEEERAVLLLKLSEDPEGEVRRFANQSSFFKKMQKSSEEQMVIESPKWEELEEDKNFKKPPHQKEKKKENIAISETQGEREFRKFKNQLIPTEYKARLLNGLKSENHFIFEYCWENLCALYTENSSLEDKKKWINTLGSCINSNKFKLLSNRRIVDHIFWKLLETVELRNHVTSMILFLLEKVISLLEKYWANLLYTALSEGVSEKIVIKYLDTFSKLLKKNNLNVSEKSSLLSTVVLAENYKQQYPTLITILVQAFNGEFGNDIQASAAEYIVSQLEKNEKIESVTEVFLDALSNMNIVGTEVDAVDQTLKFMVFVISKDGAGILGNKAVACLLKLLNNVQDISFFMLLRDEIRQYELENLEMLKPIFQLVYYFFKQSIKDQYNLAWYAFDQKKYKESLQCINKFIESSKNKKTSSQILIKAYYLKALNLANLEDFKLASNSLELCLQYQEYYPATVLQGEIKFKEGNLGEAVEYYKKASDYSPFYLKPLFSLYELHIAKENYHESEKVFKKIQNLNPRAYSSYRRQRLFYKEFDKTYVPLGPEIQRQERYLEYFIKFCLTTLKKDKDKEEKSAQDLVKKKFEGWMSKLKEVFGSKALRKFKLINEIPWDKFFQYPNQIPRYMRDIFFGLIEQEIPPQYHSAYQSFHLKIENMRNIEKQIQSTGIATYFKNTDLTQFLQLHANVFTAYEFIHCYAFEQTIKNGYALGLSSDISQAYNILLGIFSLKHWIIAYHELKVEPSGLKVHTEEFLEKVIKQDTPIVLFVPVLVISESGHNITVDELSYLINWMRGHGRLENLFLVFGAYDFLPMSLLEDDVFSLKHKSPERSFKSVVNYLAEVLGYAFKDFRSRFRAALNHMLITRIKVNLLMDVPEKKDIYEKYLPKFDNMFEGKFAFNALFDELIDFFRVGKIPENFDASGKQIICLLNSLLFHGLPWFESSLQPSQNNFFILEELQNIITNEKMKFETLIDNSLLSTNLKSTYQDKLDILRKFLSNLQVLIEDIKIGIIWLGINNYSYPTKEDLMNQEENFENTLVTNDNVNLKISKLPLNIQRVSKSENFKNEEDQDGIKFFKKEEDEFLNSFNRKDLSKKPIPKIENFYNQLMSVQNKFEEVSKKNIINSKTGEKDEKSILEWSLKNKKEEVKKVITKEGNPKVFALYDSKSSEEQLGKGENEVDTTQDFNEWWNSLTFEKKQNIYHSHGNASTSETEILYDNFWSTLEAESKMEIIRTYNSDLASTQADSKPNSIEEIEGKNTSLNQALTNVVKKLAILNQPQKVKIEESKTFEEKQIITLQFGKGKSATIQNKTLSKEEEAQISNIVTLILRLAGQYSFKEKNVDLQEGIMTSFKDALKQNDNKQIKYIVTLGKQIKDVPHDGFCLFHAIADQVNEKKINIKQKKRKVTHEDITAFVVAYLDKNFDGYLRFFTGNKGQFFKGFAQYLETGQYNSDVGDLMPSILSDALNINIIVHDSYYESIEGDKNSSQNSINLVRVNNNHYMIITDKDGDCKQILSALGFEENEFTKEKVKEIGTSGWQKVVSSKSPKKTELPSRSPSLKTPIKHPRSKLSPTGDTPPEKNEISPRPETATHLQFSLGEASYRSKQFVHSTAVEKQKIQQEKEIIPAMEQKLSRPALREKADILFNAIASKKMSVWDNPSKNIYEEKKSPSSLLSKDSKVAIGQPKSLQKAKTKQDGEKEEKRTFNKPMRRGRGQSS